MNSRQTELEDGRPAEVWAPVAGYAGLYEVSNLGRVKSHWGMRGVRFLKPLPDRNGYLRVNLTSQNGEKWKAKIHRLVCAAFHGERGPEMHAAHIDGRRTNNRADNLCWKTAAENNADQFKHGTKQVGEHHPNSKLTASAALEIRKSRESRRDLADRFGVSQRTVAQIQRKERWAHV